MGILFLNRKILLSINNNSYYIISMKQLEEKKIILNSRYARWVYNYVDDKVIIDIAEENSISAELAEILYRRGLITKKDIDLFLKSPLTSLRDPFGLLNMDKVVNRIYEAIISKELITVYGDYDVDGITSTSMLYLFLKEVGANASYYIPNRLEDGYGLNKKSIENLYNQGTKLIVTVDCGISANEEISYAKSLGVDIIITDHHQVAEHAPEDAYAIINPMLANDKYIFKSLAGVGVAFKVVMALRTYLREQGLFSSDTQPNIKKYLDIVALGTIADVVPLVDENRIFVKHGLELISSSTNRIGLRELLKISDVTDKKLKTTTISYVIVPRLNAVGRMGSSNKSLRLIMTDSVDEAKELAIDLDNENRCRQSVEREIVKESFDIIESDPTYKNKRTIVLMRENWHLGVIGIVASRIVDRYFKPTIILSLDADTAKGSARSIPAFHLYKSLESLSDMLLSFGGHKYAAGIKLKKDKVPDLIKGFEEIANIHLSDEDMIPEIVIDKILKPEDISLELVEEILLLEPYGMGNKEPVFCMQDMILTPKISFVGKDLNHLKATFKSGDKYINTIGFNMLKYEDILNIDSKYDILFTLTINEYRGNRTVQLNLKDIK